MLRVWAAWPVGGRVGALLLSGRQSGFRDAEPEGTGGRDVSFVWRRSERDQGRAGRGEPCAGRDLCQPGDLPARGGRVLQARVAVRGTGGGAGRSGRLHGAAPGRRARAALTRPRRWAARQLQHVRPPRCRGCVRIGQSQGLQLPVPRLGLRSRRPAEGRRLHGGLQGLRRRRLRPDTAATRCLAGQHLHQLRPRRRAAGRRDGRDRRGILVPRLGEMPTGQQDRHRPCVQLEVRTREPDGLLPRRCAARGKLRRQLQVRARPRQHQARQRPVDLLRRRPAHAGGRAAARQDAVARRPAAQLCLHCVPGAQPDVLRPHRLHPPDDRMADRRGPHPGDRVPPVPRGVLRPARLRRGR